MSWLESILLGLVQGLTEFLPVSSSGHLVIFQKLIGLPEHMLAFDIAVHMGTLFSVFVVYRQQILQVIYDLITFLKTKNLNRGANLFLMVFIGSIPTAIIGFTLKDMFERLFQSLFAVGIFLFITGLILLLTRNKQMADKNDDFFSLEGLENLKWWHALVIGTAQGGAIAPGISRAGSTIATGILVGLSRKTASLFSFMLSIPAILGATLLEFKDIEHWSPEFITIMSVGFVSAFVFGLIGLKVVLHFVKKGRLEVFTFYLWALSFCIITWHFLKG